CERFETDPDVICCSATIGNPAEHAGAVTGRPADSFAVVDEDTSATGPTNWLFWNPPRKSEGNDEQANQPDETVTTAPVEVQSDVRAETDGSSADGEQSTTESTVSADSDEDA